jgi:exodeoxyribonuclease V alpha subunit
VPAGAHLLFVGDVDQLPSVGAGEVLRDLLGAKPIPRVRLTEIFRQAQESGVVVNSHRINHGQSPEFGAHPDFFLFPSDEPEVTAEQVVDIVAQAATLSS